MQNPIHVVIELPEDEAWAFAQFLKRAGQSDYLRLAENEQEAYSMVDAGEALRKALSEAQCAPR